jgi:hypothetical protein
MNPVVSVEGARPSNTPVEWGWIAMDSANERRVWGVVVVAERRLSGRQFFSVRAG